MRGVALMLLRDIAVIGGTAVRQNRRGILGWVLVSAGLTVVYVLSFRSIGGAKAAAVNGYPASLKQALNLQDLTSTDGYLNSTAFGIPLLLITSLFAIGFATRVLAGDEESGALDLVLSYPVGRAAVLLGRFAALGLGLAALAVSTLVPVAALAAAGGLHIAAANLVAVVVTSWLLGCCLGSIGLLAGALTGHRSSAAGIAGAAAVVAYLCSSFLPLIAGLHWVRHLSPYSWFNAGDPLANGIQVPECLLLLGLTVVCTAGALVALNHRDLRA